jgi:integrase
LLFHRQNIDNLLYFLMVQERLVEHLIHDEKNRVVVSLIERPGKDGRTFYHARFKVEKPELANGQKFIVQSMRTDDIETARKRAYEKHASLKYRQDSDTFLTELSVNDCINRFLKNYEKSLRSGVSGYTDHMYRGYRKNVDIYWREYLGEKDISSVQTTDLEGYEIWRQNWAKTTTRKRSNDQRYKETISKRTIEWEINAFKTVLRWSAARNYYKGRAFEWRYSVKEKNRRSAFTRKQYRKLHTYMRTNEFLSKGKHGNDSRIERHRTMLRAYILFMTNTGLRVGETRHLRWSDISQRENKLGKKVVLVRVLEKYSKVKKSKTTFDNIVGRNTAFTALERWKKYLMDTGEGWTPDKYIFCNPKGEVIGDFREGFNSVIREAGVEFDADGNKLVIYSLRHTYITFRLQYGKNLSIHSLAKNCRTSVQMLETWYSDALPEDYIDELSI